MRYVLVVLFLSGCATAEQRAAYQAAYLAQLEESCIKIGFARGSEGMASCKLHLMNSDRAAANAQAGVAAQNVSNVREAMRLRLPR
jgi:hypothetical protein